MCQAACPHDLGARVVILGIVAEDDGLRHDGAQKPLGDAVRDFQRIALREIALHGVHEDIGAAAGGLVIRQGHGQLRVHNGELRAADFVVIAALDADEGHGRDKKNDDFKLIFDIATIDSAQNCFSCGQQCGYFGVDYETYMRSTVSSYSDMESDAKDFLLSSSKPIIAKYVAEKNDIIPGFIENIINVLR